MLVSEIMTRPVVGVRADATPQVVLSLPTQGGLTMLPVVGSVPRTVSQLMSSTTQTTSEQL